MNLHAAIDPALLVPPSDSADLPRWIERIGWLTEFLADNEILGSCPTEVCSSVLAGWWERSAGSLSESLNKAGHPVTMDDLIRLYDGLDSRVNQDACDPYETDVLLEEVRVEPQYGAHALDSAAIEEVIQHLGELACLRALGNVPIAIVTERNSWSGDPSAIRAEAKISDLEGPIGPELKAGSLIRETLPGCLDDRALFEVLFNHSHILASRPAIGVRAAWGRLSSTSIDDLSFLIAPRFVETLIDLGYDRHAQEGRARSCFRAMAYVASGNSHRLASLNPHPHHKGGKPVRENGRVLLRGYIYKGPNAHRLFWWQGDSPEFLGITGHDDPPPT